MRNIFNDCNTKTQEMINIIIANEEQQKARDRYIDGDNKSLNNMIEYFRSKLPKKTRIFNIADLLASFPMKWT